MSQDFPNDISDLIARLDRAIPPHTKAVMDGDGNPLVETARRLAQGPDVRLSTTATSLIEARLREHNAALQSPDRTTPHRFRRHILRYAAAALLTVILAMAGLTSASANSLPGDQLYPIKRAAEDVHLALASDEQVASLRVDFAERRIGEFEGLLVECEVYPRALEEASNELNQALDLLNEGYGDRVKLVPRMSILTQQQDQLVQRAAQMPISPQQFDRLQQITDENKAIQQRLATEGTIPGLAPDVTTTPTPTPASTPTYTPEPGATVPPAHTPAPAEMSTPIPEAQAAIT
jgi:hypothetical protein